MMNSIQAVFIDRDGTIGGNDQAIFPGEFEMYPYVEKALEQLRSSGLKIYALTNQPGVSRGEVNKEDFEIELKKFGFDKIYLCPHEHLEGCRCRKPSPGMLMAAAKENDLDLRKCMVIGDRWTDMLAAHLAGCMKILVKTGAGMNEYQKYKNAEFFGRWAEVSPNYIAEDLRDAVNWIMV